MAVSNKSFYNNKANVDQYIKMAEGHSGAALIEQLQQHLPPSSTVLELGSGPGTDWVILNEHYTTTGSDFSNEFLRRLQEKHPEGKFLQLDAETLATPLMFDGIYSNKVLHLLSNEALMASIQRQYEQLNPNGIVCHSFWKGEGTENYEGMSVNNHLEAGLQRFFEKHFEILLIAAYKEFEAGDSLLLIGRKK